MTTPSTETRWLFPSALFGQYRDCRKSWGKLLDAAWQADSWEAALAEERHADVRADASDIVYEIGRGPIDLQIQVPQWWVSYAGDVRPRRSKSIAIRERDQALIRSGLKYLWYVIAHLGKHTTLPWLQDTDRFFTNKEEMLRDLAEAAIAWLPEILELAPRLTAGSLISTWRQWHTCPCWVIGFRQSLGMGGYDIITWPNGRDLWGDLSPIHNGDPIKFLELMEIIKLCDGKYGLGDAVVRRQ